MDIQVSKHHLNRSGFFFQTVLLQSQTRSSKSRESTGVEKS